MLTCQRALFQIPEGLTYLNCAYLSPLLKQVREAGQRGVARKASPWEVTPEDFFRDSSAYRHAAARLIHSDPDGVAIVPSVSYGLSLAARNLSVENGQSIVVLQDQFPSNVYVWQEVARQRGASMHTVARPDDWDWTRAVLEAIGADTAVVAVPHAHWMDGSRLELEAIGRRAREVGAALVVDGTQSVGAMHFSVEKIQPDFLAVAGYKWCLGPYGLGFVYVSPRYRQGLPIEYNWLNRMGSEDFAGLVNYTDEMIGNASRFDMGERSNFILLPMGVTALESIAQWGVMAISDYLGKLTEAVVDKAREAGFGVIPSAHRSPHLTGIYLPEIAPDLLTRLRGAQVHVSVRGNAVRISPYLYNTLEDIERLFEVLGES